jgi:hypothetical protein
MSIPICLTVVINGCETWSLTRKEKEQGLMVTPIVYWKLSVDWSKFDKLDASEAESIDFSLLYSENLYILRSLETAGIESVMSIVFWWTLKP